MKVLKLEMRLLIALLLLMITWQPIMVIRPVSIYEKPEALISRQVYLAKRSKIREREEERIRSKSLEYKNQMREAEEIHQTVLKEKEKAQKKVRALVKAATEEVRKQSLIYGDLSDAEPTRDARYYDCRIPTHLTVEEVGGYSIGGSHGEMPEYNKKLLNGSYVNFETDSSYGLEVWIDEDGCYRYGNAYITAIQKFFYPEEYVEKGFPGWSLENRGQYFDVILTDGTVIPFIVVDTNSEEHTNTNPENTDYWQTTYLNYPEYENLFSAYGGNNLEISGLEGCNKNFMRRYGFKVSGGDNQIAFYRMYDAFAY